MKIITFSTFLLVVLITASCKLKLENFYTFVLINNSNVDVECYFVRPVGGYHYPDTTLLNESAVAAVEPVPSNEQRSIGLSWEYTDFFHYLPSDTLSIFIFDSDVYENTDWSEIRDNYNILKRYDLSLGDLERLKYVLTYPPDASMDGVRMYPPE